MDELNLMVGEKSTKELNKEFEQKQKREKKLQKEKTKVEIDGIFDEIEIFDKKLQKIQLVYKNKNLYDTIINVSEVKRNLKLFLQNIKN